VLTINTVFVICFHLYNRSITPSSGTKYTYKARVSLGGDGVNRRKNGIELIKYSALRSLSIVEKEDDCQPNKSIDSNIQGDDNCCFRIVVILNEMLCGVKNRRELRLIISACSSPNLVTC
jgi:hypothetical protein